MDINSILFLLDYIRNINYLYLILYNIPTPFFPNGGITQPVVFFLLNLNPEFHCTYPFLKRNSSFFFDLVEIIFFN